MLSWLIDYAKGEERTVRNLVLRVLVLNFAAIHTSSTVSRLIEPTNACLLIFLKSITHALFQVAANPQYAAMLREEVESVVTAEGWSHTALDKMHKLDSILKECLRSYGVGPCEYRLLLCIICTNTVVSRHAP